MNDELYQWLETMFKRENHPKYRKYFEEWVSNLTEIQIQGFQKQMTTVIYIGI